MHPVSAQFHTAMGADNRRVFGRVTIDYTDPFIDQSVQILANQQQNAAGFLLQTADTIIAPTRRWASADGSTLANGLSFPAPLLPAEGQMGWWGTQVSGAGGAFVTPFPTLTVSFASRPVHILHVVGDSARGEFPVDFTIRLLGAGGVLRHERIVTGNTLVDWREVITPVTQVTSCTLEIRRWSHVGRQAKILEFFSSVQETYEADTLMRIGLLEERELALDSLPVGNVTANEITVMLDNSTRKFDSGNNQSPLYQLLKQNRRIRAWLGLKGDGSGMNMRQAVDFNTGTRRNLVVNAGRLELPVVSAPAFARASGAYAQDGTLVNTNLPRFETGRFGQAVMVEEGVTNLLLQSAAFTVTPWAHANVSFTSQPNYLDFITTRVTPTGAGVASLTQTFLGTTVAGRTFTWSFWARGETTRSFGVNFWDGLNWQSRFISLTPTWQRFELTNTFLSGGTFGRIQWGNTSPHWGITYMDWIDLAGVQLEERPYATTYMETGATIAARAAESLTIPTAGILSPAEGTIEFWARPNHASSVAASSGVGFHHLSWHTAGSTQGIIIRRVVGGIALVSLRAAGNLTTTHNMTWIAGQDIHIAARWTATDVSLFVNGALRGTIAKFDDPGSIPLEFGWRTGHTASNALHDDLRISNRARSDAEIAAAFNSGQPLVVDANTTYILRANGNLNHGQGGDYTSPEYDLSIVGTTITSNIAWQAPVDGVTRDVSARLDGQAWTPITNGGTLPFMPGQRLTNRRLQLNALLRRE